MNLQQLFLLRDSCLCNICRTEQGQRKTNILLNAESFMIKRTEHFYDKSNRKYIIYWKDNHISTFNYEDILFEKGVPFSIRNKNILNTFGESNESIFDLLTYMSSGYVVINQTKQEYVELINSIGFPQSTIYSQDFWNVTLDKTKNDTAYQSIHLDPHTDCTYMSEPPALISFHCIEPALNGGETLLVDSKELQIEEYFREKQIDWFSKTTRFHLQHKAPIFTSNIFRFNHYDYECPDLDYQKYNSLYKNIIEKTKRIKLEKNQTILINNHRILHGRTAFTGYRNLIGCYIDINIMQSILRKLL